MVDTASTTTSARCPGCGKPSPPGRLFHSGHDRAAEAVVIRERYGSIAEFLARHGFGPDNPPLLIGSLSNRASPPRQRRSRRAAALDELARRGAGDEGVDVDALLAVEREGLDDRAWR